MSEQDVRQILNEVIADLDSGRVAPPRRSRLARFGVSVGAPAALAVGLALGACDEPMAAYGVPPIDSAVHDTGVGDAGPDARLDDGSVEDYGVPVVDGGADANLDDGAVVDYGVPQVDGSLDDGAVVDYGVPQVDSGQ